MADRFSRFRRIEKPRTASSDPPAPVASERFRAGREAAAQTGPAPHAPEREPEVRSALAPHAREREAQVQSGMALDEPAQDEQPFLRCGQCEADSSRFATRCPICGAALDTPEQRAFNDALWAQRQAERAALDEELRRAHEPPPPALPREYGEALAQQVAEREHARLGWMNDTVAGPGVRLLQRIPDPSARLAASAALGVLALLLAWASFPRGAPLARILLFALAVLFLPSKPRLFRR